MNGKCIIIDYCLGDYSAEIVNLDNTKIEQIKTQLSRHGAYKAAMAWVAQYNLPVRVKHGSLLTMPEQKDIEWYHLKGGSNE